MNSTFTFGDKVKITGILKRVKEWEGNYYWKSYPVNHENCIFLGYRNLYNGRCDFNDGAVVFIPKEHFNVVLVAINSYTNPVYVDHSDVSL